MSHILGPRNETLSLPWYSDFINGLENSEISLRLYQLLSFYLKISFMMGGDIFILTRNISIARD